MTIYILHGGGSGTASEANTKFFSEITSRLSDGTTILCVYYARPEEDWNELFVQDKRFLQQTRMDVVFHIEQAAAEPQKFLVQLQHASAVFIRGGETDLLKSRLKHPEQLNNLFQGKIIAGSSADAYILSTYYYSNGKDILQDGFGILPIKVFCHYTDQKKEKLISLQNYKEDLPIYQLCDQEYAIIETKD